MAQRKCILSLNSTFMNNQLIYYLTVEDVQNVAQQEIKRKLSSKEITIVREIIGEKIDWYDAIAFSISDLNTNKSGNQTIKV